jgi:hypothetical protein
VFAFGVESTLEISGPVSQDNAKTAAPAASMMHISRIEALAFLLFIQV